MPTMAPVPRFTVVVPAHNEVDHLGETLSSLLAQQVDADVEIVVVDNASSDGTGDLARAYGVVVVEESRRGVCWARQRGVDVARGEIVVSADADTTYPPRWLARIDARFRAEPDLVALGGPCRYRDAPWWAVVFPRIGFGLVALGARAGYVAYATAANLAFRREGFPGYDTRRTQGGDEAGLLARLRPLGRIGWDPANPVTTSSRRLDQGLLHTLLVSYGYHYALNTALARVTGRNVLGSAPAVRARDARRVQAVRRRWTVAAAFLVAAAWVRHRRR